MTEKTHKTEGAEYPAPDAREVPAEKNRAADSTAKTASRGKWVKGMPSPNPGGRPKTAAEANRLLRNLTAPAVRRLWKLANSKDPRVAVTALKIIIDRGLGRLPMTVQGPGGQALPGVTVNFNAGAPIVDANAAMAAYLHFTQNPGADFSKVEFRPPAQAARPALADRTFTDAHVVPERSTAPEASEAVAEIREGAQS